MNFKRLLADPVVRGICIGSCVDGSRWSDTASYSEAAHAHIASMASRYPGYICVRSWDDLFAPGSHTRVSDIVLEELAHLRADAGHTAAWRQEMGKLGVAIPAMHRRKR